MRIAIKISGALAGAAFAAYLAMVGVAGAITAELNLLPFGAFGVAVLAVLALSVIAWVSLSLVGAKPRPRQKPGQSPVSGGIRVVVPGQAKHGRMVANLNIHTREHAVRWQANGSRVGVLVPGGRGGFDVEHDIDGHLGWTASVRDGMAVLEAHELR